MAEVQELLCPNGKKLVREMSSDATGGGGQEVGGDGKTRPIIISLELITTTALHHVIFIWPKT